MIDVYIGVINDPDSMLQLEFDSFAEASDFCDIITNHYKEERRKLFVAIDNAEGDEDV